MEGLFEIVYCYPYKLEVVSMIAQKGIDATAKDTLVMNMSNKGRPWITPIMKIIKQIERATIPKILLVLARFF